MSFINSRWGALRGLPGFLLYLPPLFILFSFLIYPVVHLFLLGAESVATSTQPLPDYFWSYLLRITGNTFVLGLTTTIITQCIALPLAFLLIRTDFLASRFWIALFTIPLITPPFIMAFAVLTLYGRSGLFAFLFGHFGIFLPPVFGLTGLVITQLIVSIPYSVFIIAAGFQGVPRHVEESAMSMGAPLWKVFWNVTLPCVYPHIVVSGLMIFLMSIGDVGGPLVIGGGFPVLSSEIYTNFLSLLNDERIAILLSLWIILLSFLMLGVTNWLLKFTVKQYRPETDPLIFPLRRWKVLGFVFMALVLLFLLSPFLIVFIQSFSTIWVFSLLPEAWTLENYYRIFHSFSLIKDTLLLSVPAMFVILFMSLTLGHKIYLRQRLRFLNFLLIVPFVLPGIVLSVGVLRSFSGIWEGRVVVPPFLLLFFTVVIRRLPYGLKSLEAGYLVADSRREEAARSLGANPFSAFLQITLPQMRPFVLTALIMGLVKTATELSASLILAPPDWQSLSLGIVYYIEQGQLSRASALSVLLITLIGTGTFLTSLWRGRSSTDDNTVRNDRGALESLVLGRTPLVLNRKKRSNVLRFRNLLRRGEPLLLVEDRAGIVDANTSFLKLTGADSLEQLRRESSFSVLFFEDKQVLELFSFKESLENRATSLLILDGSRVPILLNAYVVTTESGCRKGYFYCRRVSGRAWRIREYRRIKQRMNTAEQTALKAQITPHFLFNTLNSVIELIDYNPQEAREVVQNLADLYRYILAATKKENVTVAEEIESVQNYLTVEKSRFGKRLNYTFSVAPEVKGCFIAPMLLQPLVENAVNHGGRKSGDIEVGVSVYRAGIEIVFRVTDGGDKFFDPAAVVTGNGTGLKNVEGRLYALYRRKIVFKNTKTGGLSLSFSIPEEKRW